MENAAGYVDCVDVDGDGDADNDCSDDNGGVEDDIGPLVLSAI
jgi:hypothetical protein